MSKELLAAIDAAHAGGQVLQKYWGKLTEIDRKATSIDLVTNADRESEQAVIRVLTSIFPDYTILGEESGWTQTKQSDYVWAVDPLDGTTNYTHQFPFVCVSIGLLQAGRPVAGVIYNPILDQLFYAVKGQGAFFNKKPIHVSKIDNLEQSLLCSGFAYDRRENPDNNYAEFCRLTHCTQGVRRCGSAALDLAFVAAGHFEGYWERGIKIWDIAAGIVLVQEAGGRVSNYENESFDPFSDKIVATNGRIHAALCGQIAAARRNLGTEPFPL